MRKRIITSWLGFAFALLLLAAPLAWGAQEPAPVDSATEKALTYLIQCCADKNAAVDMARLIPLLRFAETMPVTRNEPDYTVKSRDAGSGAVAKFRLKTTLSRFLEYYCNPAIPGAVMYPNSVRLLTWRPGSEILQAKPLWETRDLSAPVILRGAEYEEITPDTNSGSYYSYPLSRLLILTQYQGKPFFITVSVQTEKSSVGKKSAIVGKDEDWNYVYTQESGATASGIGWMDTYIYDSCTIGIFYADSWESPEVYNVAFKWLSAGWMSMNVVKSTHIWNGVRRYHEGMRAVLESPGMPSPADLAAEARKAASMSEADLKASMREYARSLEGAQDKILSRDAFKKVLAQGMYVQNMDLEHARAQYLLNYVRRALGKE